MHLKLLFWFVNDTKYALEDDLSFLQQLVLWSEDLSSECINLSQNIILVCLGFVSSLTTSPNELSVVMQ